MADHDVFLSYDTWDKEEACRLASLLRERGLNVWLDQGYLLPGSAWQPSLEAAKARSVLVLIGSGGADSWQHSEMRFFLQRFPGQGFTVIPVLLPGAPKELHLPSFLAFIVGVDFRNGISHEGLDRLVEGLLSNKAFAIPATVPSHSALKSFLLSFIILIYLALAVYVIRGLDPFSNAVFPNDEPPTPTSPSYNQAMDDELRQAWADLKEGRIAYDPKPSMSQGKAEEVTARIALEMKTPITKGLKGKPWVERLRTSGSMSAYLDGAPEEFEILARSSTRQAIVGPYTEWVWEVTPLRPGEYNLNLRVVARIRLSNQESEEKDVIVKRARIVVVVEPPWAIKRFIVVNWQWLLGSPLVLGVLAWLIAKRKSWPRKRKPIGFADQGLPTQPGRTRARKSSLLRRIKYKLTASTKRPRAKG